MFEHQDMFHIIQTRLLCCKTHKSSLSSFGKLSWQIPEVNCCKNVLPNKTMFKLAFLFERLAKDHEKNWNYTPKKLNLMCQTFEFSKTSFIIFITYYLIYNIESGYFDNNIENTYLSQKNSGKNDPCLKECPKSFTKFGSTFTTFLQCMDVSGKFMYRLMLKHIRLMLNLTKLETY